VVNQFNRVDSPLHILRVNIDQYYLGTDVLDLTEDGVGGASRKSHMTENIPAHPRSLQPMLEDRKPLFVFCKKGNRYALHGRGLTLVSGISMLWSDDDRAK
jgi:hypothetical protein